MQDILVSVCCITYNQEKYIKDTIEGVLAQKVNFKYEFIIHDDASSDSTAKIIKEYEKKYPNIIRGIFQKENQHSKGERPLLITMQEAKGKYIALCEGDDYWIDENKLQLQIEYMEKNPSCTFCFHNGLIRDEKNLNSKKNILPIKGNFFQKKNLNKRCDYDINDFLLFGAVPTASVVLKREAFLNNIPDWYKSSPACDIVLRLVTTYHGYAHYINRCMSVYRVNTGLSVTDEWRKFSKQNYKKSIDLKERMILVYDNFNTYSNFTMERNINKRKNKLLLEILSLKIVYETNKFNYIKQIRLYELEDFYILIKNLFKNLIKKFLRKGI